MSPTYGVVVEEEGTAVRPAWRELVDQNPGVALSKMPEWVDCVCGCDRFTDASLLLRGDDGRRFVLPRVAAPVPGMFASPPNNWNLGADASGFLAEGGEPDGEELRALVREVHRRSGVRARIVVGRDDARAWREAVPGGVYADPRTSQVLDLDGGFDKVWSAAFSGKVRSNARKAERRGVSVESDSTGRLIPTFYELFGKSVDRWARDRGLPAPLMRMRFARSHPRRMFDTVPRVLDQHCTVWLARRDGQPIAAIMVLSAGDRVTYWRGAMDKRLCRGTGANELLHRHAIEAACAQGRRSYDFGLSNSEDLRRFKATFGAHEEPVTTYTFEPIVPTMAAQQRCRALAKRAVIGAVARLPHR
ncbi:GNAT family N-acetyltransferase [Pseudonocardia acaciae]|uniref:GNAT family N-acetyltransferase n=1 Tax=Pseudonocardia acaciae TaxID=551276 RepID=UPI000564894A|nr:GNAT family N-acetyltransferase [Pseudonocardia acaciae]